MAYSVSSGSDSGFSDYSPPVARHVAFSVKENRQRYCSRFVKVSKNVCRYMVSSGDFLLQNTGRAVALVFSMCKNVPHYRFVIRPIYKALVPKLGCPAATICTFVAANLIFHQIPIPIPYPTSDYGIGLYFWQPEGLSDLVSFTVMGCLAAYFKYKNPEYRKTFPWPLWDSLHATFSNRRWVRMMFGKPATTADKTVLLNYMKWFHSKLYSAEFKLSKVFAKDQSNPLIQK